ncbi:MAG: glycosyltransferase [Alphaproteobacteria bacterium]|nr:glycosyltransferase [Alphaproteobacteria bacterium]
MTAALYYHPEAYTTGGPRLLGRNAAGESFLRGFLAHSRNGEFWVQVPKLADARQFTATVRAQGRSEVVKAVDKNNLADLAKPGTVYHPGPGIGEHAWQRATVGASAGHSAWSLCGITHAMSSRRVMDAVADWLTAPVQPWDAVICTSRAVKGNVTRLLQAQTEYLVQRLGMKTLVLPQLPVIPLGIHCQDFVFSEAEKLAARAAIGADARTVVVLYTGRLSFHAKAHPLAMYQALERTAATLPGGQELLLVECGWHANETIEKAYAEAAGFACPSVRVVTLDGRQPAERQTAWAAADVFCSLADNIEETFGLVPIEAMAAGIPVVVSDWDGYKDTVRDGVDGFRVPTLMASPGLGNDLAFRHALEVNSYDMYCGHIASLVAVDVAATARAFERLFTSPDLRRQMAEAGRQRARALYDWAAIIPQYEALWAELAERRKGRAKEPQPLPHPWPARMDPFAAYARYPTQTLTAQTVLSLVDADADTAFRRVRDFRQLLMVDYVKFVLPTPAEIEVVLNEAASGPKAAADLIHAIPAHRQTFVFRSLTWLVKLDILRVRA